MVSNLFKFGSTGVGSEKQFLKHDWVDREANAAVSLGREQLCRRWVALEVSDDDVCVQEGKRPRPARLFDLS